VRFVLCNGPSQSLSKNKSLFYYIPDIFNSQNVLPAKERFMQKSKLYKYIAILTSILLIFTTCILIQGCMPEPTFGEIAVCEDVEVDTGAPINPKSEFDMEISGIYSVIEVFSVKGDDNLRFQYGSEDTGEIIYEDSYKYYDIFETKGYISSYVWHNWFREGEEEGNIFLEPGNYIVEYYHNGELIDNTPFVIKATEPVFGKLVISEEIDDETNAPIDPKNEFDIKIYKLWFVIEVSFVKGEDNYSFQFKNEDTGEILLEDVSRYSSETDGYLSGYCVSGTFKEEGYILLEPGNYCVNFYHNDILIDSAIFKVNKPDIKITSVTLSSEVDENFRPINPTNKFYPWETIWACVMLNYDIKGNAISSKWYYSEGDLLHETENETEFSAVSMPFSIYFPPTFTFLYPGNYYVEIFLNGKFHDRYDFEVLAE
jgi:hypothetical protein